MKPDSKQSLPIGRRRFVLGAGAILAGSCLPVLPSSAASPAPRPRMQPQILRGNEFELNLAEQAVNFTGVRRIATTVNQSLPAPILRWREGERVRLKVTNHLNADSSIHWHGIILPTGMDGVPGLSFDGIKPHESFTYEFELNQSGTYWYHSHSEYQEQTGLYGAIIVDAKEPEPFTYDREHVILLSDWTDENPARLYAKLKKQSHYYNFRERTAADLLADVKNKGLLATWRDRAMWNQMRMSETDIADVTGYTYTYLMNGNTPDRGWFGAYAPGEKLRLRIINGSAMSIFDVRIPGLKMTVVAADGQNVQPVLVDEFRIGVAETYDVIVEPQDGQAYTVFAQNMDRSGYARGILALDDSAEPPVPAMDHAPILEHRDMGMDHGAHAGHQPPGQPNTGPAGERDHSEHQMAPAEHSGMDHSQHQMGAAAQPMDHSQHQMQPAASAGMDHSQMDHGEQPMMEQAAQAEMDHNQHQMMDHTEHQMDHSQDGISAQRSGDLGLAGFGSKAAIRHAPTEYGPHVDMRAEAPQSGLHDPGVGLREHQQRYGRRVLTYADLRNLGPTLDKRQPSREIQLHLSGNMNRYMWSIDGVKFSEAPPIELTFGERLRFVLVNDTMMTHPIHLHGLWSELETGDPDHIPRKHSILVQPGATISYLVTADAKGRWAYHCHLLYHMLGMMREVRVS